MSMSVEPSSSTPWRNRTHEDITLNFKEDLAQGFQEDIPELKGSRYYYRLASESSRTSEDGSESIYSVQGKETDVVRDTTDTESIATTKTQDDSDLQYEYEVASLSGSGDDIEISTTDSEGIMLAAAATVICDSSLEAWITDVEDSDSTSDGSLFQRSDFTTCVQCKGGNDNPQFRYCEKCFQDRKRFFPPRPRRKRRRRKLQQPLVLDEEDPVKLDALKNCLSSLSQDSGIGCSQECPSLGLDLIVVPERLQGGSSGTSKNDGISTDSLVTSTATEETESDSTKLLPIGRSDRKSSTEESSTFVRKRRCSESSLSDFAVMKKAKLDPAVTSDLGTEISSTTSSFSSSTMSRWSSGGSVITENSGSFGSDKSESELCIFCNSAPKNSIFLHTNIAHRCCCYPCAKKTWKSIKRCPICNMCVTKVVKIFTS